MRERRRMCLQVRGTPCVGYNTHQHLEDFPTPGDCYEDFAFNAGHNFNAGGCSSIHLRGVVSGPLFVGSRLHPMGTEFHTG